MLSSRYYPANLDTINSRLDVMHNMLMEIAEVTRESKRDSMSVTENALEQNTIDDIIHLMKLRFQRNFPNIPYYRIIAVPENFDSDLIPQPLKQSNIPNILRNPPNIRKDGFGFQGVYKISSTPEGWVGESYDSQPKIILLQNGFIEQKEPLLNEHFQWRKDQVMRFANTKKPWLYPYAVCEYPVSFLRLIKSIYSEIGINYKIHIRQEYWHIDDFILVSGHPGGPFFGSSANNQYKYHPLEPDQTAVAKRVVEPDFNPDQVAYDLIKNIYSNFGIDESSIPLFDENHNFTP